MLNLDRLLENKNLDEKVANLKWALSHESTHIKWENKLQNGPAFKSVFSVDGQFQSGLYNAVQEVLAYAQSYEDMSQSKFNGKYKSTLLRLEALIELGTGLSPAYILGIMKNPGENSENLMEIVAAIQKAALLPQGKIALGILVGRPADETILNANGYKVVITGKDAENPELKEVAQAYGKLVKLAPNQDVLNQILENDIPENKDIKGYIVNAVKESDPLAKVVAENAKGKNSKWFGIAVDLQKLTPPDLVRMLVVLAGVGEDKLRQYLRNQDLGGPSSSKSGLHSLEAFSQIFGKELVALQSVSHSA